ncbi:MAG: hypothetical protein IKN80_07305 [Clostridiales bacterium]|nr:hypothetical protein [Clostridiales bacterium]
MTILLYKLIEIITYLHEKILSWNDAYEYNFTDKQLHFIVIGVVGMAFLTVIHPLFKYLAAKRMVLAISWIYVVTLLIVITFAIEIGQRLTKTGTMDFRDIIYGMGGFFLMFGIFYVIRLIVKLIAGLLHRDEKNREAAAQ